MGNAGPPHFFRGALRAVGRLIYLRARAFFEEPTMRATGSALLLTCLALSSRAGVIDTVAGTGKAGYSGDGGPATRARLDEPNDCCLDGKGGLLIADVSDWRVRRLDLKTGVITTFAGTGRRKGKLGRSALGDGGPAAKAVLHGARAVCV